jgi:hypothetical protein
MLERGEAERPDGLAHDREARRRAVESQRRRLGCPQRQEEGHRVAAEPAERERERGGRRRVEPLGVVDGEHHRSLLGKHAQRAEERRRDGACVGRLSPRRAPEERHRERVALWPRERRQQLVEGVAEEIGDRREGERHLGLRGTRDQHACPRGGSGVEPGLPDRRLADPRLALDEQDAWPGVETADQVCQLRELVIPADDHGRDGTALSPTARTAASASPP